MIDLPLTDEQASQVAPLLADLDAAVCIGSIHPRPYVPGMAAGDVGRLIARIGTVPRARILAERDLAAARARIAALEAERDAHQKMGAEAILRNVKLTKTLEELHENCGDWRRLTHEARDRVAALEAERDRLKAGIKETEEFTVVRANIIKLHDDLAASRAREQRLREALELALNTVECASIETRPAPFETGMELPWYKAARAALAAQEEKP